MNQLAFIFDFGFCIDL